MNIKHPPRPSTGGIHWPKIIAMAIILAATVQATAQKKDSIVAYTYYNTLQTMSFGGMKAESNMTYGQGVSDGRIIIDTVYVRDTIYVSSRALDSIEARKKFVADSLVARQRFAQDSAIQPNRLLALDPATVYKNDIPISKVVIKKTTPKKKTKRIPQRSWIQFTPNGNRNYYGKTYYITKTVYAKQPPTKDEIIARLRAQLRRCKSGVK